MLKAKDHIVWRQKDDVLVVLDTVSGHYYTLNSTAVDLWTKLVIDGAPTASAVEAVLTKYSEAPSRVEVEADCRRMIDDWSSSGLVEEAAQPS